MNEHFINIKVDREERPDVDDLYMLALQVYFQAIGSPQGTGWPLSMFLTPEGAPFSGGTYFPAEDRQGLPGFGSVLEHVQGLWADRRDVLEGHGEILVAEVKRLSRPVITLTPTPLEHALVDAAVDQVVDAYDSEHGGVDFRAEQPDGPKFPVPSRLALLQSQIDEADERGLADIVDHTLSRIAAGGIRDHLGGGFHRYSTDRRWLVPHFEKMLYDNAQLAELYADAHARTNLPEFRTVAEETLDFVLRELTDPRGGFYSALDAETDGVEGKFYVWSPEEVVAALGQEEAAVFAEAYGVNLPEFFEHGYVLHLPQPLHDSADQLQMSVADLTTRLTAARARLLEDRQTRDPLLRDDKVLTSWNGLMIRAFAHAGRVLDRPDYIQVAEKAAMFVAGNMRDSEGRLHRTYRGDAAKLNAYLDDYAFLVSGLLELQAATGDSQWLNAAVSLTDDQIEQFWDEEARGFFFTPDHHEELIARPKNAYDSVIPAGNSVAVRNLVRLGVLTGDDQYRQYARETLEVFAPRLQQTPAGLTQMALALDEFLTAAGDETAVAVNLADNAPADEPQDSDDEEELTEFARPTEAEATKHENISASAYLSVDKLPPGESCQIAIVIDIKPGWHINANPAQPDFLKPTELTIEAAAGVELTDVKYPESHEFEIEGFDEPLLVYEEQAVLIGTIQAPASAASQTETLELTVSYQACNDQSCLRPMRFKLTGEVPIAAAGGSVRQVNASLFAEDDEE